ncbi:MAG: prepilin-type N-terminal cleavage/methylation domain-containing protein [Verrucomicrobiota bacterium]
MVSHTKNEPVARTCGFTILELLVSMAVFAMLTVLIAQLTISATAVATSGTKRMDADSQARMIFDRMANDFAKMVKRPDVDCIFAKQPGNDAMFFFSEAPAYSASGLGSTTKNTVALVGYRISTNSPKYQPPIYVAGYPVLERLGETLAWDGTTSNDAAATKDNTAPGGMVFFAYPTGSATPDPASTLDGNWANTIGSAANHYTDGADQDYHVLSDTVYRMELAFLLTDGTVSTMPVTNPSTSTNNLAASAAPTVTADRSAGYTPGSRWFNTATSRGYICTDATTGAAVWNPIGVQDVSAVIVAIALLDNTSRKIIAGYDSMATALPDAAGSTPIAKTWKNGNYLTGSGIPQAAASQLRIYQRTFYLNK